MTEREVDKRLKQMYAKWLSEMKETAPCFLDSQQYSNPYYACVPKGWCSSNVRILMVGEEGFGTWGRGRSLGVNADDIQRIQEYCWTSLVSYLNYGEDYELYHVEHKFENLRSPFWQRARKLAEYGICAWTNQDAIHVLSDKKCALKEKERIRLHSTDTKMLAEEIRILTPTHVVFFGWYGVTLQRELPSLFSELYPNGPGDSSVWKNKVVHRKLNGIHYIAAYHPGWGQRQTGYEETVIEVLENTLRI